MPDVQNLALFVLAGVLLNLTPGVDLLYILGQAAARGLKAGIVATAGVCAGCGIHIAAATLGVSAVLATSATAFTALKAIGAAYLIYLGLRLLLPTLRPRRKSGSGSDPGSGLITGPTARATAAAASGDIAQPSADARSATPREGPTVPSAPAPEPGPTGLGRIFIGGSLTNALNPKVALFFLAFLPQFIAPASSGKTPAMLLLGLLFVFNSFFVNVALAWAVTGLAQRFGERPGLIRWLQRLTGGLFLYFGLRLLGSRLPG